MMLKRITGFIAAVAAAVSVLPFPAPAEANALEYCWVEAEDAAAGPGFQTAENEEASGGKLLTIYQTAAAAAGAYTVDMEFDVPKNGQYDLWVLSCPGNTTAVSKFKWSLNGSEPARYASTGETNHKVYMHGMEIQMGGAQQEVRQNIQWNRVAAGQQIEMGKNTFSYMIDAKSTTGTRSYISMLDCLVAVPSSYGWEPGPDLTRPAPPPKRPGAFAWIELENFENPEACFRSAESEEASGGKMLYAYNLKNDSGVENFNYSFSLDNAGKYELWYLGCETAAAATHLSGMWWNLDSPAYVTDAGQRNNTPMGENITVMNSAGEDRSIPMYWQKLGTEELDAGEHSLNLAYAYRTLAGAENTFITWADCVAVIPAGYGWTPPADPEAPDRFPGYDAARLDATYIRQTYFTDDYTALTGDIVLPENLLTPAGSVIGFTSGAPEVMSDAGKVTRPYFTGETAVFNFYIDAAFGKAAVSLPVEMTVLKYPKYHVQNFDVYEEGGEKAVALKGNREYTARAALNLNAAEDSGAQGSAAVVMALYDSRNALCGVSMASGTVTPEGTEIEAAVAVGEAEAGCTLRVYLINNFNLANQIADTLIIQ